MSGYQTVVVGTDESCTMVLTDSTVSRRHLEVSLVDDGVRLRDLGSRNGTFIQCGDEKPRRLPANVIERVGSGHNVLVGSRRNRLVLETG